MINTWRREAWFDNYHRHRPVTRLHPQSFQRLLWAHGVHQPGTMDSQLKCHCSQLPMEIFSLPPSIVTTYLLLLLLLLLCSLPVQCWGPMTEQGWCCRSSNHLVTQMVRLLTTHLCSNLIITSSAQGS